MKELFQKITAADYTFPDEKWANVSEDAKLFIGSLLVVDPEARLTGNKTEGETSKSINSPPSPSSKKTIIKIKLRRPLVTLG